MASMDDLLAKLTGMETRLTSQMKELTEQLRAETKGFGAHLDQISLATNETTERQALADRRIYELEVRNSRLMAELDALGNVSRRPNILVYGIPESDSESVAELRKTLEAKILAL